MANSCRDQCPAPEGRHSRSPFHAAVASDATTVSPFQGFQTWLSDSPTAHAVGYDLPPSGLKTETLRTLTSEKTDFGGKRRPIISDLPETPDEPSRNQVSRAASAQWHSLWENILSGTALAQWH